MAILRTYAVRSTVLIPQHPVLRSSPVSSINLTPFDFVGSPISFQTRNPEVLAEVFEGGLAGIMFGDGKSKDNEFAFNYTVSGVEHDRSLDAGDTTWRVTLTPNGGTYDVVLIMSDVQVIESLSIGTYVGVVFSATSCPQIPGSKGCIQS